MNKSTMNLVEAYTRLLFRPKLQKNFTFALRLILICLTLGMSLGVYSQSPGGVPTTGMKLWLKADAGTEDVVVKNVPTTNRTASSTWGGDGSISLDLSRLVSGGCWAPAGTAGAWIQLDLGSVQSVDGVVTIGRDNMAQWVTQFTVSYSSDNISWTPIGVTFNANWDQWTWVTNVFPSPVTARYIRIFPTAWNSYPGMRVDAFSTASNTADNSAFNVWRDKSGANNHPSNMVTGERPVLKSTSESLNFNPLVKFSGAQQLRDLDGMIPNSSFSSANAFVVCRTDVVQNSSVFQQNLTTGTQFNLHAPWGDGLMFWDGSNSNRISTAWGGTTGEPYLWTGFNGNSGETKKVQLRRNGKELVSNTTALTAYTGQSSALFIGGPSKYNGAISEILIYTNSLTATERKKIESYLAIKYGITLDQTSAQDYLSSAGDVIWDATLNSIYKFNLAGIGRDDNSVLNQKQSRSINPDMQIVVGNANTIATSNLTNTTTFAADKSFLVWGDNGVAKDWTATGAPNANSLIQKRIWKMQETGTVGSVKISISSALNQFNIPPGTQKVSVLTDADPDFTAGSTEIPMTWDGTNWVANVDVSNSEPFLTFVIQQPVAPGGVFAGNTLWIKANGDITDNGTTATSWLSQSADANPNLQIANIITGDPHVVTNTYNYNPAVNFDGNDYYSVGAQGILQPTATAGEVFVMTNTLGARTAICGYPFQFGGSGPITYQYDYNDGNVYDNFGSSSAKKNWDPAAGNPSWDVRWPLIYNVVSAPGEWTARFNGNQSFTTAANTVNFSTSTVNATYVGASDQAVYFGNVAEIALYNRALTVAERARVNSYYAIKYGVSLSQFTAQNYVNSAGAIIWDATANATFKNNIAGIARDDASGLYQKQSRSISSGFQVAIANGSSLAASNAANASTISADKSSMLWSDNGLATNAWTLTGAPTDRQILPRIWKVQEVGTIGSVLLQVRDFPGTDCLPGEYQKVYLLVDADGNFSAGATEIEMTLVGSNWEANADIANGQFFTFATQIPPSPGGVYLALNQWLRADVGVTGTTAVSQWDDQSTFLRNATQATAGSRPALKTNGYNFNPVLYFDGSKNMDFSDAGLVSGNGARTMFGVASNNTSGEGVWRHIVSYGTQSTGNKFGLAKNTTDGLAIVGWGTEDYSLPGTIWTATDLPHLTFGEYTGTQSGAAVNGATIQRANKTLATILNNGNIGASPTGGEKWYGNIGEVIQYNRALSTDEINKVNTYLAIKYGKTLDQTVAQNYTNSAGDVIWDATANSAFKNNIAGIARDDKSVLNQKQSKTINEANQVLIGVGTLTDFNSTNTGTFAADKTALVWGDNGLNTYFEPKVSTGTNIPAGIPMTRMNKIWKVQETLESGNVTVAIPSNLFYLKGYLVTSSTADFSSGNTFIPLSTSTSTINGTAYFTVSTNLATNTYFTFAEQLSLPGGVASDKLWIKGDEGVVKSGSSVTNWKDASGYYNHCTAFLNPVTTTINNNYNYAVTLDGISQYVQAPSGFADYTSGLSAFVVAKTTANNNWARFLDFGRGAGLDNIIFARNGTSSNLNYTTYNGATSSGFDNTGIITSDYNRMYEVVQSGTSATIYKDGANAVTGTVQALANVTRTNNYIGRSNWGVDSYFKGDFAEVILFSRNITAIERQKVESYLAIKYGLTLNQTVPTDYLNSKAEVVWNATTAGAYKNHISGIGRDDASGLNQKQSNSVGSDLLIAIGNSNTIAADNASNTSSFAADNSFMIVSDNHGSISRWLLTGAPAERMILPRTWNVQETGTVGSVKIQVKDYNNYFCLPAEATAVYLLVDNDADFATTATEIPMTLVGSNWEANVDLTNGQYFTFATQIPPAPGGVALDINQWMRADMGNSVVADGKWYDQSPWQRNGQQTLAASKPAIVNNASNFNPGFYFDGGDNLAYYSTDLSSGAEPRTQFAVASTNSNDGNWRNIVSYGLSTPADNRMFGLAKASNNNLAAWVYGANDHYLTNNIFGTTGIVHLLFGDNTGTQSGVATNGSAITRAARVLNTSDQEGQIGTIPGGAQRWIGNIYEVIQYNRVLTDAEINKVNTYLAIKYGKTLDQTVAQNYVNSAGAVIWDATANATYKNNISGIARDDKSLLNQKQSRTANIDTDPIIGLGTISSANDLNTLTFADDKTALVWGSNGLSNLIDGTLLVSTGTNLPAGPKAYRMSCVWKVQETLESGVVQVAIPKSVFKFDKIQLLTSSTADFSANNTFYQTTSATINGTDYYVASANLSDNSYFTFTMQITAPGGVTGERIWLDAAKYIENIKGNLTEAGEVVLWRSAAMCNWPGNFESVTDLGAPKLVSGYYTRGNDPNNSWLTGVTVYSSNDNVNFTKVGDFGGASGEFTKVGYMFSTPVTARYFKFVATSGAFSVCVNAYAGFCGVYLASQSNDNNTVSIWNDISPNNNHVSAQSTSLPIFFDASQSINFNPVVKFNNNGADLRDPSGVFGTSTSSFANAFAVSRTDALTDGYIFYESLGTGGYSSLNVPWSDSRAYWDGASTNRIFADPWTGSLAVPHIWTGYNGNTGETNVAQLRKDGALISASTGAMTAYTGNNSPMKIGTTYNGAISELVIYNRNLTLQERQRVESYLAIKYGKTLATGDYLSSNGTVVWNATANATYKNNIAGIGRDDESDLVQKQSKSVNSGLQVVIGNGNTLSNLNRTNTSTFSADQSFMVWGDNNLPVTPWSQTGAPNYRQIIPRVWKVQEVGTVGSVKMQVADNSGTNGLPVEAKKVYVLVDTDNDFTTGATEYEMTLVGTNWSANVDLADGQYFTFATQTPPGPGGVYVSLNQWHAADMNVTLAGAGVSQWDDQSIMLRNATQATAANQPTVLQSSINYNPVLVFDGTNDRMDYSDVGLVAGAGARSAFNVAAISVVDAMWRNLNSYGTYVLSQSFGTVKSDGQDLAAWAYGAANDYSTDNNFWVQNIPLLTYIEYNGTKSGLAANGGQISSAARTLNTTLSGIGKIGASTANNQLWQGNIAEVIQYNSVLSAADINKVNTYLAIKYGKTLDQTVAQNYTNSAGKVIWNASTNSGFKTNIAGIARDDRSLLNQKQSKSINGGFQIAIGNENTIAINNAANATTFAKDTAAFVWGDNNLSPSVWIKTGAPKGRKIIARTWKSQETGTVGSLKVQVVDNSGLNGLPAEINKVYLLVDADGDFTTGATEVAMTLNGTNWEVNNDFTNTMPYFTFATEAIADLMVTKTVDNSTPNAGSDVNFTITAKNIGPDDATAVKVVDALPSGYVFVSATPSTGTFSGSEWTIGNLAKDATATCTVIATANCEGNFENMAVISGNEVDPVSTNDTARVSTTPVSQTNVAVAMTVDKTSPAVGENVVFTVTASNAGPCLATNVNVNDLLPAGFTFVSATPSTGTYTSPNWSVGTLTNGASANLVLVATVNPTGPYSNVATIAGTETDPVVSNNTATVTVTPIPQADVSITKAVDNMNPSYGQNVTFTITVTNNGLSGATNVVVNDVLPSGYTFVSATPSTGSWTAPNWTVGNLANAATATLTMVATVKTSGVYTNTASVTATETDPVLANNTTSLTPIPNMEANLGVSVSVDKISPKTGENVTITVIVNNAGPNTASNVLVDNLLPAGLTFVSANTTAGTWTSPSWALTSLNSGVQETLTIVATVAKGVDYKFTSSVTNGVSDPVQTNNSAEITLTPVTETDLSITKVVDKATPNVGDAVTFTITATNTGYAATGVKVTDVLPSGYTFNTATPSVGTWTAPDWTIGNMANGATATLTLVAIANAAGDYENTATISGNETDPATTNNTAKVSTTPKPVSDLAITKTVLSSGIAPITQTFTITVSNNGPSVGTNVVVSDPLKNGFKFKSATTTATAGTLTKPAVDAVGGTVTLTLPSLAVGESQTLTIVADQVEPAGDISNTVSVSGAETDLVAQNNSATTPAPEYKSDISLVKTVSTPLPVYVGNELTYSLVVSNAGPDYAGGIVLTDDIAALGLTDAKYSLDNGTSWTAWAGNVNLGFINPASSKTVLVKGTVPASKANVEITNSASVTCVTTDEVPGNNTSIVKVTPLPQSDVNVVKTASTLVPNVGDNVTFTISASNAGPSDATGVKVTDALPTGYTFVSAQTFTGTYTAPDWNIGLLPNGATATLTIVGKVKLTGDYENIATISSPVHDPKTADNVSKVKPVPDATADLSIAKTVNKPNPKVGENVIFTLTATNAGPGNATSVVVNDVLPTGYAFVGATPSVGSFSNSVWTIGNLANGANATMTVTAMVKADGNYENTAVINGAKVDPDQTNNNVSVSTTPVPQSDVTITKTADNMTPNVGDNVVFTINVSNAGPSPATNVVVNEVIPTGYTLVSVSPSVGTWAAPEWKISDLAKDVNATLTVVATVNATGNYENTATVVATEADPFTTDNTAKVKPVPVANSNVGITMTADNTNPYVGQNVTFTITATNAGPSDATGVNVQDLLPAGFTFVSASPTSGTWTSPNWTVGNLPNGATQTITVVATVNPTGPYTNTANITGTTTDPVTGDNTTTITVVPIPNADVIVDKTADIMAPPVGTNVTFTISASNAGPSSATEVKLTDVLPSGYTLVSATPSIGTVTGAEWLIGTLAKDEKATLTVVATVNQTGDYANTASIVGKEDDLTPANNTSTVTPVPVPNANLNIAMVVDNPTPTIGDKVTFTITASNNGPSGATGVKVQDLLPAGYTFVSATPTDGTWTGPGTWTIGNMSNNGSATLVIEATVNAVGPYTNTATISGTEHDSQTANNTTSVGTTPVGVVQTSLSVVKSVDKMDPKVGDNVVFTLTALNEGPGDATDVKVTDVLPSGYTFVSAVPSTGTWTAPDWVIGDLPNGVANQIQITATVNATGDYSNTAVIGGKEADPALNDNTSIVTPIPVKVAKVKVEKIASNLSPNVGENVTFTITASNAGPNEATNVRVTDALPNGYTFVSASQTQGLFAEPDWVIGNITSGANATLTVVAKVNATGNYANTAEIVAGEFDSDVSDNTSTVTPVPVAQSNVTIAKTVSNQTPNVGDNVIFTITASNAGPSDATNVKVSDVLADGYEFVSATTTNGAWTAPDWTIGTIANGITETLEIVAKVKSTGTYANTANIVATEADPTPADNTSTVTPVPVAQSNLSVVKTVDKLTPTVGENVIFTLTASNAGPSDATNVKVTDVLPAGYTFVGATPSTGTWTAPDWTIATLANGATATMTIEAKVLAAGPYENTATISGTENDAVAGNNSSSVSPLPVGVPQTDLSVTKTVDNMAPYFGSQVTFTIKATNAGPDAATNVKVTDVLPSGYTFVSATSSTGTFTAPDWTIASLAKDAEATLSIIATVNATGNYANTATIVGVDNDPASTNNTSTVTPVPTEAPKANVSVSKIVNVSSPVTGSEVKFTITATNAGPSDATNVKVSDELPSGYTFVRAETTTGSFGANEWTIGTLANGATATLDVYATVNSIGTYKNIATISATEIDETPANNTSSATTTPVSAPEANLSVVKTVDNLAPEFGSNVIFTITATNAGPADAANVVVTDVLPNGYTLVGVTPSIGDWTAPDWTIANLANGASATLTVTAKVNASGDYTNSATISGGVTDPSALDNTSSVTPVPVGLPVTDLKVVKIVDNTSPKVGSNVKFTITASNAGPNNATNVKVTDVLQNGYTFVNAIASTGTFTAPDWTIGNLGNGETATLEITATVKPTGDYTNTATITGTETDPVTTDNEAIVNNVVPVPLQSNLAVTKTVDNTTPKVGTNVVFTITATNSGPDAATNVKVSDVLKNGYTFVSATPSNSTTWTAPDWTIGTLANGLTETLTITARVNPSGDYTNTATITGTETDPVTTDNEAVVNNVVPVELQSNLAVVKTVDNSTPKVGTNVTFTITASNAGPDAATNVKVTDALPSGYTFVSATPSIGTFTAPDWTVGNLANGASATLTMIATVKSTGIYANTATISGTETDPSTANNSSTVTPVPAQLQSNLSVAKTVDNSSPKVGNNVTFTITASNAGPDAATNVKVTDVLPTGYTFVSATPSTGTFTAPDWTIGNLANGATATLTMVATVKSTGVYANTATISGTEVDPSTTNNSSTVTPVPVQLQANLAVAKTVDNMAPKVGTNVTFTITASNAGPDAATNVMVIDALPSGYTFVSATPSTGTFTAPDWTIGNLANGATATLTMIATVKSTGVYANTATISGTENDPSATDNTSTVTPVPVQLPKANLSVVKTIDKQTPVVGETVTFTIVASNAGPADATGVKVVEELPDGYQFVKVSLISKGTSWSAPNWTIGSIANGASDTIKIEAIVKATGSYTNTATISGTEEDPDAIDNTSTVSITPDLSVQIPTAFSPGTDGYNDKFVIPGIENYPNAELFIYNRWGNLVYKKVNYDNSWDGLSNTNLISLGTELQTGTYFYLIDLKDGSKPKSGFVVLRREK